MTNFYESDAAVEQYLLFHYGTPEQTCPLLPAAGAACGFPVRCVTETLKLLPDGGRGRALDLGCAVGRSSLELGRLFNDVTGIDFSARFVAAAERMRDVGTVSIRAPREGGTKDEFELRAPPRLEPGRVHFEVGDACTLRPDLGSFDLVLMANLIDRLPDPAALLRRLPELVVPGGWAVFTSPYTWLEDYTPRAKWIGADGGGTLKALKEILAPTFAFHTAIDLPFLIREHRRKYQWSIAEASLWRRL